MTLILFVKFSDLKINFICICLYCSTMETPDAMLVYDKYDEMIELIQK